MRVNMDSSIVSDPRFKLVAMSLGVRHQEIIGCCYLLWLACYERRSERLSTREANACVDLSGFAEALIAEGLADDCGDGDMIVHGVTVRISFLKKQAERGAKGGKSKKKSPPQANAKQTLTQPLSTDTQTAQANTLTPTPALSPTPTKDSMGPRRRATAIPSDWQPSDKHIERASQLRVDLDTEAERFANHHGAKGSTFKNWDLAFSNWLIKAGEYQGERAKVSTRAPEVML